MQYDAERSSSTIVGMTSGFSVPYAQLEVSVELQDEQDLKLKRQKTTQQEGDRRNKEKVLLPLHGWSDFLK